MTQQYTVIHYQVNGRDIFEEWLDNLRDTKTLQAIDRVIYRIQQGNFGDHKPCRDGVWELRINAGAGYRIYYSINGKEIILLLCGGSKRTQTQDINKAVEYLKKYKEEHQ